MFRLLGFSVVFLSYIAISAIAQTEANRQQSTYASLQSPKVWLSQKD